VESSVAASIDGARCNAEAGSKAPAHQHHEHSQCCIFCNETGRDTSALLVAVVFNAAYFLGLTNVFSGAYVIADEPRLRSIGWTSSWSSRAPPSFSWPT